MWTKQKWHVQNVLIPKLILCNCKRVPPMNRWRPFTNVCSVLIAGTIDLKERKMSLFVGSICFLALFIPQKIKIVFQFVLSFLLLTNFSIVKKRIKVDICIRLVEIVRSFNWTDIVRAKEQQLTLSVNLFVCLLSRLSKRIFLPLSMTYDRFHLQS